MPAWLLLFGMVVVIDSALWLKTNGTKNEGY
jgi:hypothetical protein